MYTFQ